jgi:hypothetical protein
MKKTKTRGMYSDMSRSVLPQVSGDKTRDPATSGGENGGARRVSVWADPREAAPRGGSLCNRKVSVDTSFSDDEMRALLSRRRRRSSVFKKLLPLGEVATSAPGHSRAHRRRSTVSSRHLDPLGPLAPTPVSTLPAGSVCAAKQLSAISVTSLAMSVKKAATKLKSLTKKKCGSSA